MTFLVHTNLWVDSRWLDKDTALSVAASLINKYALHGIRTPEAAHKLESIGITLASRGIMPRLDLKQIRRVEFLQALMRARTSPVGPVRGGNYAA